MNKFFNFVNDALLVFIFLCLCLLAWASVFVWQNFLCAFLFFCGIVACFWAWNGKDEI